MKKSILTLTVVSVLLLSCGTVHAWVKGSLVKWSHSVCISPDINRKAFELTLKDLGDHATKAFNRGELSHEALETIKDEIYFSNLKCKDTWAAERAINIDKRKAVEQKRIEEGRKAFEAKKRQEEQLKVEMEKQRIAAELKLREVNTELEKLKNKIKQSYNHNKKETSTRIVYGVEQPKAPTNSNHSENVDASYPVGIILLVIAIIIIVGIIVMDSASDSTSRPRAPPTSYTKKTVDVQGAVPTGIARPIPTWYNPDPWHTMKQLKTMTYSRKPDTPANEVVYLETYHWRQITAKKRESVNCCEKCGSAYNLQTHHPEGTYDYRGEEQYYMDKLEVLCKTCHEKPSTHAWLSKYSSPQIIPVYTNQMYIANQTIVEKDSFYHLSRAMIDDLNKRIEWSRSVA